MALKIIAEDYELTPIYSEVTKFALRNENTLKLIKGGLESKPIIDTAVPVGKEWMVHLHIEVHERKEKKP